MAEFFTHVFNGIGSGVIYASLALALVLIYRTTGLLNFAQGEMALFTTYGAWKLTDLGLPIGVAVAIAFVAAFLGGALIERIVIRPVEHSSALVVVIVTIGLFLAFNSLAQVVFGEDAKVVPSVFGDHAPFDIGGAQLSMSTVGLALLLVVECLALYLLLQKTKLGLSLRAVASNPTSARLVGISSGTMLMVGWAIAAGLGGLGAIARVSENSGNLDASLMQQILVFSFAAAAIGGFDSPLGAVVGGLIVGVVNSLTVAYFDWLDQIELLAPVLIIMVVLLVRPTGLFGRRIVERV